MMNRPSRFEGRVRRPRHQRRGNGTGEDGRHVIEGQPGDDRDPIAAGAHQRRQSRRTDTDDGGGADTREQRGTGKRQYDVPEDLAGRQSKRPRILQVPRINAANAGKGVEHHRQQTVETQRRQCRLGADTEYRNEKAQQRQRAEWSG